MNEWKIQSCVAAPARCYGVDVRSPHRLLCLNAWSPAGDCFRTAEPFRRWVPGLEVDSWGWKWIPGAGFTVHGWVLLLVPSLSSTSPAVNQQTLLYFCDNHLYVSPFVVDCTLPLSGKIRPPVTVLPLVGSLGAAMRSTTDAPIQLTFPGQLRVCELSMFLFSVETCGRLSLVFKYGQHKMLAASHWNQLFDMLGVLKS